MIVDRLDDVDKYWPQISWAFDSFEERTGGDAPAEELRKMVRDGYRQCWVAFDEKELIVMAVALTEITGPMKRVWVDYTAGRKREAWQEHMQEAIETWAKGIGASGIKTVSRTGWTPFLKAGGYRETHRIMEKVF